MRLVRCCVTAVNCHEQKWIDMACLSKIRAAHSVSAVVSLPSCFLQANGCESALFCGWPLVVRCPEFCPVFSLAMWWVPASSAFVLQILVFVFPLLKSHSHSCLASMLLFHCSIFFWSRIFIIFSPLLPSSLSAWFFAWLLLSLYVRLLLWAKPLQHNYSLPIWAPCRSWSIQR